ncbi:MAG: hypothetical protein ACRCU2_29390 [Planktothrix sp.]
MSLQKNVAQEIISDAILRIFTANVALEMDGENPELAEILVKMHNDLKTRSYISWFSRSMIREQINDNQVEGEALKEGFLNFIKVYIEEEKLEENLLKYIQKYETDDNNL